MDVQIRNNGIKISDGLRQFIDRRMSKLDRLSDQVVDAQLELQAEHTRGGGEIHIAQLTLKTGKHVLRAEAEDPDVAHAIDIAIDKLIRQVRKYNEKRTQRKQHVPPANELVSDSAAEDPTLPEDLSFDPLSAAIAEQSVSRKKQFQMDPMGIETAIEQMELIGHDFFFFKNADDEKFSVLYRRRDGSYGILAPE